MLLTAACGGSGQPETAQASSAAPSPSLTVSPELEQVKVTVDPGKSASIALPSTPFNASRGYRVVKEGNGPVLAADQAVAAQVHVVNGKDGKTLESSYGKSAAFLSLDESTLLPDIRSALVGQKVGSQVLVATQAGQDQAQTGISATDTLVFFFEVQSARTPLKQATGTPVPPKAGLPTVTMGATPKDPATISVPKSNPPSKTVAQPLIIGTGPKVVAGQRIRVSYTGVTWRDPSKPFDYSGRTPNGFAEFDIGRGQLIKAWDNNLVGQPVGSRLLLVVPPADGYGAAGQPDSGIKGTDTLVFVLDILDAR